MKTSELCSIDPAYSADVVDLAALILASALLPLLAAGGSDEQLAEVRSASVTHMNAGSVRSPARGTTTVPSAPHA